MEGVGYPGHTLESLLRPWFIVSYSSPPVFEYQAPASKANSLLIILGTQYLICSRPNWDDVRGIWGHSI